MARTMLMVLVPALAACDCRGCEPDSPSPKPAKTSGNAEASEPKDQATDVPNKVPEGDSPAPAQRVKYALSRPEIVNLILQPGLTELTVEMAKERFAAMDLQSTEPLPASLLLVASSEHQAFKVGFNREKNGPWSFAYLRLDVFAKNGDEAKTLYGELTELVRDKLGEPQWVKEEEPFLARGFTLDDRFDVNVGAIMNDAEGRPYGAIAIALRPPELEPPK